MITLMVTMSMWDPAVTLTTMFLLNLMIQIQAILENAALDQFSIVGSSAPIGNCLTGRIDLGFRTDEHNHIAKVVRHHAP